MLRGALQGARNVTPGRPIHLCFQTVVLGKTLENLLDRMEIQSVHPKGNEA